MSDRPSRTGNEMVPNPLIKPRPEIEPIDLWDAGEDFSIAGILRGPDTGKKKPERKEEKLKRFLEALATAFTTSRGQWDGDCEDHYVMKIQGDVHRLLKLAEQAESFGGFVVRHHLDDVDFRNASFIDDGGYGPQHLRQALRDSDRSHVVDRLREDDYRHAIRRGSGPAWLIFDTKKDQLTIINSQYARRILHRSRR